MKIYWIMFWKKQIHGFLEVTLNSSVCLGSIQYRLLTVNKLVRDLPCWSEAPHERTQIASQPLGYRVSIATLPVPTLFSGELVIMPNNSSSIAGENRGFFLTKVLIFVWMTWRRISEWFEGILNRLFSPTETALIVWINPLSRNIYPLVTTIPWINFKLKFSSLLLLAYISQKLSAVIIFSVSPTAGFVNEQLVSNYGL